MKFSIGHRLFVSVLLAILAVAVTAIALMRQNVMSSFGDYAVSIELDRLDQLSHSLASRYRGHKNWDFLAADQRGPWVAAELARLQRTPPMAPPAPPTPPVPAEPAPPPELDGEQSPPLAPLAPMAPIAPIAPVAPVAPLPPPAVPDLPAPPMENANVDELGLQDRVTLLDADGRYLAGRQGGDEAGARRAIEVDGKVIGHLVVAKAARPSDAMSTAFIEQLKNSLLIIVVASIALSALAAVLLAAHFRKPILRLADGARALADGKYDTRLTETRSDELGELAHSFNQLAQKLDQVEATRRQWVADTSHELRTPLSVLRAQLEALQDGVRTVSPEGTAAMLRQVLSLNALIDQLYALARADVGQIDEPYEKVDLWHIVREQAAAFDEKISTAGLSIETAQSPGDCSVLADPERLRQLFANIFENCIRYCGSGSRVTVQARCGGTEVDILIDDSGAGVPDDTLPRLAERFYRVEGSRSREHGGAGLGLALCHRIATACGGSVLFARSPLGGLQVLVRLPLAPA
ncbi:MAG: ATP-binding protein [Pseudomonadota bacterium]